LLLPDFNEKHYVLNIIDTPGHPNFLGELVAGMRMADAVILVIDAIEGVMLMT
jgi:U5 small nuclear ribonucleoprotein component